MKTLAAGRCPTAIFEIVKGYDGRPASRVAFEDIVWRLIAAMGVKLRRQYWQGVPRSGIGAFERDVRHHRYVT